ncbi:MAG TPA: hypothetical protein VGH89_15680, partial [Pseudonocardia sp.]
SAWPAAGGVLVFGPAEQAELNRRFALAASIWSLPSDRARPPKVPEPGQRRRRAIVDLVAVLCVLPLLLMAVPTVGPWLDLRGWALLLAAAAVAVAVPVLVVQALIPRWPLLVGARARALGAAAGLLVLLVLARLLISVPLPPTVVLVVAAGVVAVLTPVALRLLPLDRPALIGLALLPVLLALLATPVGDLLDGVYLERLGLRPTDVALSFAQRWLSGAYFGVIALAGVALAAALWGAFYQLDAVGRRRAVPPAPVLALLGLVYAVALLALSAGAAGRQAGAGNDGLPGRWGGIAPVWVCWSAPPGGYVPYTGAERPPTGVTVAWLGGASGRFALWSGDTGGATVSDQVQLRIRPSAGPCG